MPYFAVTARYSVFETRLVKAKNIRDAYKKTLDNDYVDVISEGNFDELIEIDYVEPVDPAKV